MISLQEIQISSRNHTKEILTGQNEVTLAGVLSDFLCQSSAGEVLYPNYFAHQRINMKNRHPAEKL